MTEDKTPADDAAAPPLPPISSTSPTSPKRSVAFGAAIIAAIGLGAGATAIAQLGHRVTFVKLDPAPVTAMTDGSMVAVKGEVAEAFGNKFIVQDSSGRALVETGRRGEGSDLVTKGEDVTVQGRFAHGFIHAVAITHKDGRSDTLDPPPPPPPPGARPPAPASVGPAPVTPPAH